MEWDVEGMLSDFIVRNDGFFSFFIQLI